MGFVRTTHTLTLEVLSGIPPLGKRINLIVPKNDYKVSSCILNDLFWLDWTIEPLHRMLHSVQGNLLNDLAIEKMKYLIVFDITSG